MAGTSLEVVHSFKYLGVYLDSRLMWRYHIKYLQSKLEGIFGTFSRLSRNTFGLKSNVALEIYRVAIEPVLLYAIQAWGSVCKYKWAVKELTKIQRMFLLRSCKAYRTVSADALCVIADIKPIALRIEESIQITQVRNSGRLEVDGEALKVQTPMVQHIHPAHRKVCAIIDAEGLTLHTTARLNVIYTDGSGSDNGIGSAFVEYQNEAETHHAKFKLPSYCSVFQAELYAIWQALRYAKPENSITIYSDSRASLQAIADASSSNELVLSIQEECTKFVVQPHLLWVKAHAGTIGNERADELAKEAALSGATIFLEAPMSFAKKFIRTKTTAKWNEHWTESEKGVCTRLFFPTIPHRKSAEFLEPNFILTQFLSGHGKFAAYLSRFRIWRSGACECGALQEPHHLIRSCPATASLRAASPDLNLTSPFQSQKDFNHFTEYINNIHKLLLFWEAQR